MFNDKIWLKFKILLVVLLIKIKIKNKKIRNHRLTPLLIY